MKTALAILAIVIAAAACTPQQVREWTYASHGPDAHLTDEEAKFWADWMLADPIRHYPGDPATEMAVLNAAKAYGIDPLYFASIGWCESRLQSWAQSPYYKGTFQHDPNYWWARASAAGYPGVSYFDAEANAMVSAWLLTTSGAYHWPNCA